MYDAIMGRIWAILQLSIFMLTSLIDSFLLFLPQCHDGVLTTATCVFNTPRLLDNTSLLIPHTTRRPDQPRIPIKWIRWTYPRTCCGRARQSLCRPTTDARSPAVTSFWQLLPSNSGPPKRTFSCPVSLCHLIIYSVYIILILPGFDDLDDDSNTTTTTFGQQYQDVKEKQEDNDKSGAEDVFLGLIELKEEGNWLSILIQNITSDLN